MFTFFLLLILGFILLRLLRFFLTIRRLHNKARAQWRRATNQAYGQQPDGDGYRERPGGWSSDLVRPRKKIITRDVGEYVKFTEVKTGNQQTTDGRGTGYTSYRESQVSDAEWEDIS